MCRAVALFLKKTNARQHAQFSNCVAATTVASALSHFEERIGTVSRISSDFAALHITSSF